METTARRPDTDSRSLIALFSDLWRETTSLLRDEAELAKAEMSQKVSQVTSGVGVLAIGGAITLAGFIVVLISGSAFIAQFLPADVAVWLGPLIVGGVVMIVGLIALAKGRSNLRAGNLGPTRTTESLRRDAELAKEHLR
jgi:Putative Actinobacterial Holin-X, holin superfamily III